MTEVLGRVRESELRRICWERIESLEHWLRRLIEDCLSAAYGDYWSCLDSGGKRVIAGRIANNATMRRAKEPHRYPRVIDALLLDDAIDIICNPQLFQTHFRGPLNAAFPEGHAEARTFLRRIASPRNNLAHANPISLRQAEQIICYTNDIVDSLKVHYRSIGMQQSYDAPLILRVTDSFGTTFTRAELSPCHDGGIMKSFLESPDKDLRPGDTLTVEVEIDPSYDPATYEVRWTSTKPWSSEPQVGNRVSIPIQNRQVAQQFDVHCNVVVKRDWHRMHNGADDFLLLYFRVLPPIE